VGAATLAHHELDIEDRAARAWLLSADQIRERPHGSFLGTGTGFITLVGGMHAD
jgi:hypothetical protein